MIRAMHSRSRFVVPVLAALLGSCVNGPVDPATFASAVSLDDAITRAATAYEVPRDLLAAVAWSESPAMTARVWAWASWAWAEVAVLPVPMAQTGS